MKNTDFTAKIKSVSGIRESWRRESLVVMGSGLWSADGIRF
jgi:hypothetical protein